MLRPAARIQLVTVLRPRAKTAPRNSQASLAADLRSRNAARRENHWHGGTSWCEDVMAGSVRVDWLGLVTAIVPDGPAFVYPSPTHRLGKRIAESTAPMKHLGYLLVAFPLALICANRQAASQTLQDKTLVVWAAPANLTQQAGSALTIDDGQSHFDGIVFGEIAPRKWMAGSDGFSRTWKNQKDWPDETADKRTFVQIAIVYRGREATIYRNGQPYARYAMPAPPREFGPPAVVLFGQRHLDAGNKESSFTGRIRDARIYDRPLAQEVISSLIPGKPSKDLKPWAWWSFADEGLREKTGRFTEIKLVGDVRIEDGCLVLGGKGASVITTSLGESTAKQIRFPGLGPSPLRYRVKC